MFNFLLDAGNYEARKVANYGREEGLPFEVDTAACSDGEHPYETGIKHPEYNDGEWVIVEAYDSRGEAEDGHGRWVATMTAETLPEELVDCLNAELGAFYGAVGGDVRYPRKPVSA